MHIIGLSLVIAGALWAGQPGAERPAWIDASTGKLESELVARHGEAQRARASRGLKQVASFWRGSDGDAAAFEEFVRRNFAGDAAALDTMFARYEKLFEQLDGHMLEILLAFRTQTDLDLGPIQPLRRDLRRLRSGRPRHRRFLSEQAGLCGPAQLPAHHARRAPGAGRVTGRAASGPRRGSRDRFSRRVPAEVNLAVAEASARSEQYIAEYNIWMHHLLDDSGRRAFPAGMRLLSHWNLRDQIKAEYGAPDGLPRQRMIARVMEHIVRQTIPRAAVDNPVVDWNPFTNAGRSHPA